MSKLQQLALDLCFKDNASFENFFPGANQTCISCLQQLANSAINFIYLWGKVGAGKSHLLAASCALFAEHKLRAAYLPLKDAANLSPLILDDLENLELLCIDDLDAVIGDRDWEEALFHCFNRFTVTGGKMVVAASATPKALQFKLSDLRSRMLSGMIFELKPLDDEEKIKALMLRAKLRGLNLPLVVAKFLLLRYARDSESLFVSLDLLDRAALREQRNLTIPFVKKILR